MIGSIILLFIFVSGYIVKDIIYHKPDELLITGKVINIETKEYYNVLTIKNNKHKYLVKTKELYSVGDILEVSGSKEEYVLHYPNQFDYNKYLHYQNIKYVINNSTINLIDHKFSIRKLHFTIKSYINNKFPSNVSSYINTLTIGNDDNLDSSNIDKIGISHLFVISGLHVSIIILIVNKLLSLFKINNKTKNVLIIIVVGLYVLLTNFLISVIRVFIGLIFKTFTKLSSLDQISFNFIIVVLINPFIINSLSFILTYIIAFFMVLYKIRINLQFKNKIVNKILNYILNILLLTLLVQLLVLPFVISINPDFNIISIFVNPIFIILVTYIYLPISFIILIIPGILPIYEYITFIFEYLTQNTANIEFLLISLGNIHVVFKVLYYGVFYLLVLGLETKKFKITSLFLVFMLCWYYKGLFKLYDEIYFLDLQVGESTVIVLKNMKQVIVIDSGEVTKNNDFTKIIKNMGIKKIDYLIISHSDSDHIGGAINLVKYVKVENLLLSYYDKTKNTNYLKKYSNKTYYLKQKDVISNKYFKFSVLAPFKDFGNINDNSLVFILELNNTKFLFTGDISSKVEKELIKEKIKVDFIKIAHHGSKTSTSDEYINNINYKHAIVMSGYYNTFGFPIEDIMNKIPKTKQLRTDQLQTIILQYRKNQFIIKN